MDRAARLEEVYLALFFLVCFETSERPIELGPESTETGMRVYRRLTARDAVAQIYWNESYRRYDDLDGSCPIRTDIDLPLRIAALAEAGVLLQRRPHWEGFVFRRSATPGCLQGAAVMLEQVNAPTECFQLLLRGRSPISSR